MKIPFKKIKQDFKTTQLSLSEKSVLLKSINLYMTENPIEKMVFSFDLLLTKNYMIPAIIIALLVATSGGTVMAAENSLPGDPLYAVKLNVNEKVMSALAVSDDAEADVQAKLAERRLNEYNKMLEKNKWSAEKEQQMTDRLQQYQDKTLALIERLRAAGKNELADDIYDRMIARANSFEEFVEMVKKAYADKPDSKLDEKVKEMRKRAEEQDEDVTPEGLKVSAEKHIRNAKDAIDNLIAVYDLKKDKIDIRLKTYIENSLAEAKDYLAKAEDKVIKEEQKDASELAKRARQMAIKARNFVNMVENAGDEISEKKLEKLEDLKSWQEGTIVRVENTIAKAERYLEKVQAELVLREKDLSTDLVAEIKNKISEASALIARAKTELVEKKMEAAYESAKGAFEKLLEVRFNTEEKVEMDWRTRSNNIITKAENMLTKIRTEANEKMSEWSPAFTERVKSQLLESEDLLAKAKAAYAEEKFENAADWGKRTIEKLMEVKLREIKDNIRDSEKKMLPAYDETKKQTRKRTGSEVED